MSESWGKAPIDPRGGGKVVKITGGFRSFADRLDGERTERLAMRDKILEFGVKFLDVALGGIFLHDLILLGAASGVGKTDAAAAIALENARKGRKVHYFALEAEDREIERRLKFKLVSKLAREQAHPSVWRRLNFLDWYTGKLDHITRPYEAAADVALKQTMRSLETYYKAGDFTAEHFEALVREIAPRTELIILDHLHYVDSDDANENRGFKAIVKRIRDLALEIGKPVIAVAHVRKGDRKSPRVVPALEDFHGTSDVPKIATKAIMLAPAYDRRAEDESGNECPWLWPTYIAATKCRFDSVRTRYVGLVNYDARLGRYVDEFDLGRVNPTGEKWDAIDAANYPEWAKEAP